MVKVKAIAFIGYPVTDVGRARGFYENVLGLKPSMAHEVSPGQWWIEYEIEGTALALTNMWSPSGQSQSGPTLALEVADLDVAVESLRAQNIPFLYGPMDTPVCRLAGITDPDGNGLTLHQRKAS
jgi:predicted enzyme related to lactoylglutathione lyase